jgi:Flp pilus assembly protein TadG
VRRREEAGSITPFVVIVSLAILMLAGLVVDGGRQLNAKGRAIAYAQEASRAGAQAIDVTDPRLDLVSTDALAAARQYCRTAMAADSELKKCAATLTTVNDPAGSFTAVTVATEVQINAILLGLVNRPTLDASGQALARPVSGISQPDSGKIATVAPPSVAPPDGGSPTGTAPPTPPEVEVTPCTPKETDKPKDPKETKGPKDPKDDKDKPDECKDPEPGSG